MSEVSNTKTALQQQLDDAKVLNDRRQMVARLSANYDFRKLILEGFCLHDAARYAQESADPALDADGRADALAMSQASGHLLRYLEITKMMGAHAERTMVELENAVAEERAELDAADAE